MDPERLFEKARRGDTNARHALLEGHRARLERMVAYRMDRRIARRVDPSDVVQEALVEAWQKLPAHLEERPVPFYPWRCFRHQVLVWRSQDIPLQ